MGTCTTRDEQTREIERRMQGQQQEERQRKKLLLLGSGSSGKSTLFKQIKRIHGISTGDTELSEARHVIRTNLLQGMLLLLQKSTQLTEKDSNTYGNCKVNLEDEEVANALQLLLRYHNENIPEMHETNALAPLGKALYFLWKLQGVQNIFKKRENLFSFPDNMDYFFDRAQEIMQDDYVPNNEDTLKVRIRTTGIINYEYNVNDLTSILIIDVGGQRNERKKWIHSFEAVTAIIYVVALNHYATVLFEDEQKNALHEAIDLFNEIRNSKWFKKTDIILFLNKKDLFIECLKKTPLSNCFSQAKNWIGPQWEGPDYHPSNNPEEDKASFEMCYNHAIAFIQKAFFDVAETDEARARIYPHVTCATDRDNIQVIFDYIQHNVILKNLQAGGLLL